VLSWLRASCLEYDPSLVAAGRRAIGASTDAAAGTPQDGSAPGTMARRLRTTKLRACVPPATQRSGTTAVPRWRGPAPAAAGDLDFEGACRGRQASRHIAYDTIASSRLGRAPSDRIGGRTTLVLELTDGAVIRISTPELGALHELEEAVTSRRKPQRDHAL